MGPAIAALSPDRIVSSDLTRARLTARERGARVRHPGRARPALPRDRRGRLAGADRRGGRRPVARGAGRPWPAVRTRAAATHGETAGRGRRARRCRPHRAPRRPSGRGSASSSPPTARRAAPPPPGCSGSSTTSPGGCSAPWATATGPSSSRAVPGGGSRRGTRRPGWRRRPGRPHPEADLVGPGGAWVDSPSPLRGTPTRGCSAVGSAPPWHGGGQGFESPQLHRVRRAGRSRPALRRSSGSGGGDRLGECERGPAAGHDAREHGPGPHPTAALVVHQRAQPQRRAPPPRARWPRRPRSSPG